jgi:hypothetical protein
MEHTIENVHILLTRDWFVDDLDIYNLLALIDQDVYDFVYANRHKYSERIRMCIQPNDYFVKELQPVQDLTDFEYFRIQKKRDQERMEKLELLWIMHKADYPMVRPEADCDFELDAKYEDLIMARKQLGNSESKYINPSQRSKHESAKQELNKKILILENEFKTCSQKVKDEDERWEQQQKQEWISNQVC